MNYDGMPTPHFPELYPSQNEITLLRGKADTLFDEAQAGHRFRHLRLPRFEADEQTATWYDSSGHPLVAIHKNTHEDSMHVTLTEHHSMPGDDLFEQVTVILSRQVSMQQRTVKNVMGRIVEYSFPEPLDTSIYARTAEELQELESLCSTDTRAHGFFSSGLMNHLFGRKPK